MKHRSSTCTNFAKHQKTCYFIDRDGTEENRIEGIYWVAAFRHFVVANHGHGS